MCRGIIPYKKKMVYKVLYNMNLVKKKEKKARDAALQGEILSFQDQLLAAHFPQAVSAPRSQRKQAPEDLNGDGGYSLGGSTSLGGSILATPPGQSWTSTSSASAPSRAKLLSFPPNSNPKKPHHQLKLYGNAILPETNQQMHIAIAAFIHGSALPFRMTGDPNFLNIIDIARNLGPRYTPPDQRMVSGSLLDLLYETSFKEIMMTLLLEVDIFGLLIYGDGATLSASRAIFAGICFCQYHGL
jgi:hypothetical protein